MVCQHLIYRLGIKVWQWGWGMTCVDVSYDVVTLASYTIVENWQIKPILIP